MSEENKTVELKDEELEKVSGGTVYEFDIVVHKGDVYVNKLKVDHAAVITSLINGGTYQVPYISIRKECDGTWL